MWRPRTIPATRVVRSENTVASARSFEELAMLLGSRDPCVRTIAWRGLQTSTHPGVLPLAREALFETEAPVVVAAIEYLVRYRDREAVPLLGELLSRPDRFAKFGPEAENVRCRTAWALGQLGEPVAVPVLCDIIGQGWRLTQAAYDALVALGPRVTDALGALLAKTPEEVHLAFAVLTQFGAPAAPCLREVIRNGDPLVRRRCSTVLASSGFGTPDLIPDLLLGLDDPIEVVRACAASGLARIAEVAPDPQLRQAVPRLRRLSSFWQLRPGANPRPYAEALRHIEKALEHLDCLPLPTSAPDSVSDAFPRLVESPPPKGSFPIPSPRRPE